MSRLFLMEKIEKPEKNCGLENIESVLVMVTDARGLRPSPSKLFHAFNSVHSEYLYFLVL